jgi:formylglycine-generating enzyme required for sulfatase activity
MNTTFTRAAIFAIWSVLLFSMDVARGQDQTESATKRQVAAAANNKHESMVLVRGATIQMGIDPEEIPHFQKIFGIDSPELFSDEVPKHFVHVDEFYLDKYPVTNAQFKRFVDANPDWRPGNVPAQLDNGNYLKHWKAPGDPLTAANHPVVNVNWYAAVAYCEWAGKRLPSESEWEHAARGGRDGLYPWGAEPLDKTRANYGGGGIGSTSPVGAYPANGYGLYDMAGNVWEFTTDEWAPYSEIGPRDPVGNKTKSEGGRDYLRVRSRRVIRGGSFGGAPVNLWVEYRDSHPPNGSREFVGFRCAE